MLPIEIKEVLFKQCNTFVNQRLQTVEAIIASNQKALQSETKSSAGDKHETGRAMLQLEMEKAGQQLLSIMQMTETLTRIDVSKINKIAHLGTVICTEKGNYFLAVSVGKIHLNNKDYFAVSAASPIGKLLLGKQKNDTVFFNGAQISIIDVF
ncbi:3-oxoacyl-ACP synthase [uncultured Polaribacter sp.]|uniref:3-oxoacyl-ACP synthase n=1 Tax=uncultured Polaribacter sp. TaxID=174711 RepID=UPI00259B2569|nr:3-oxoacyl-ACP synthase [uncultured Polaribacter sp.]